MTQQPEDHPATPIEAIRVEPKAGRGFWIMMFLSLIAVGGVAFLQFTRVDRARRGNPGTKQLGRLPVLGQLPDFKLVDQNDKLLTLASLRGRVWIADFIFVNCAGPCPVMSQRMGELRAELSRHRLDDILTVSISVDPQRDTPAALREYAKMHGADDRTWWFATGEKKAIYDLAIKGFKVVVEDPNDPDGQIIHSTRFVLIDQLGRIRGYYNALTDEENEDPRIGFATTMPADVLTRVVSDAAMIRRESPR
jgi:protein SCO1/2